MGKFVRSEGGVGGKKKPFMKKSSNRRPGGDALKKKSEEKKKEKPVAQSTNPFEVKINKQKFQVLGRPTKHERGLPGVSRAKALKKRQGTLLQEYKNKFKSNKMIDRRLGEKDPNMSVESKMEMRFLAEKLKTTNKKSKFLLGDDEVLTHRGQTLADIEKFDDPRSDSENDDDDIRLGKSFVSDAHFGGGILKKGDESAETLQNRESLIDNLIAESKKRKEARQNEKEETDDLTDKLDQDFKDVLDVITSIKTPKKSEVPPTKLPDSEYDILVRQLGFERRVTPGDKMKSAEEMAKIEKEKLDKLEEERLKRMKGDLNVSKKMPHRSADDLDDGFSFNPIQPQVKMLSYGMTEQDKSIIPGQDDEDKEEESEQEEDGGEEEEESGSGEDDDEDEFSDLASSEDGDNDAETGDQEPKIKTKKKTATPSKTSKNDEMPFVFKIPEEYEEFEQVVQSYGEAHQRTVLERMLKSNHPALDGANKPKIERMFAFLMQYIHDVASGDNFQPLNDLTPVAFEIGQLVPSSTAASTMLDVLMEKREELSSHGRKRPPTITTLVFLKLTALIFPTSDFRHPVTTPAFHLLLEALSTPVANLPIIHIGIGLCAVAYEYVSLSKRYIPEVIHYLHGLIELAIPRPTTEAAHRLAFPFRPVGVESQLLVLTDEKDTKLITAERIKLAETEFNDQFRIAAVSVTVRLLSDFLALWNELPSAIDIFNPILESLNKLPIEKYNSCLTNSITTLIASVERLNQISRTKLIHEAKKPRPLRLYEPMIEDHFEGRKKRVGSKEKLERDKLQHKIKREMKGAIREIRKDNAFLGRQKIKEQIERDTERKRKVKELLGSLATQEGEVRKMKKSKK